MTTANANSQPENGNLTAGDEFATAIANDLTAEELQGLRDTDRGYSVEKISTWVLLHDKKLVGKKQKRNGVWQEFLSPLGERVVAAANILAAASETASEPLAEVAPTKAERLSVINEQPSYITALQFDMDKFVDLIAQNKCEVWYLGQRVRALSRRTNESQYMIWPLNDNEVSGFLDPQDKMSVRWLPDTQPAEAAGWAGEVFTRNSPDYEMWAHAGCLTLAEGNKDYPPIELQSPAMQAVIKLREDYDATKAELSRLQSQAVAMREALKFYADTKAYQEYMNCYGGDVDNISYDTPVLTDGGKQATAALSAAEGSKPVVGGDGSEEAGK